MSGVLERVRAWRDRARELVPARWREQIYNAVGFSVTLLGGAHLVDENTAAVLAQLVLATVTLLFAWLHSTSGVRSALYGVVAALQAALGLWSLADGPVWASVFSIALAVLGTQVAAGRTPAPYALREILDVARRAGGLSSGPAMFGPVRVQSRGPRHAPRDDGGGR